MKKSVILVLVLTFISGCNQNDPLKSTGDDNNPSIIFPASYDSLVLNDTIWIAFGDTAGNADENLWLVFDSIGTDSRCPLDVVCFWAGDAEIVFELFRENQSTRFSLHTHPHFITDTTLFNYHFQLCDVLPYPHSDSSYTARDYFVKLVISE